jgi:hypothetical protein
MRASEFPWRQHCRRCVRLLPILQTLKLPQSTAHRLPVLAISSGSRRPHPHKGEPSRQESDTVSYTSDIGCVAALR